MEITGGTGAPGPAGPAGPATKGQDANYLVWIDPSNSNKATAYNTHTGVNDYTGTTTDVVLSSILTALGSGGGVVKLSPDTHTWAATITPTAPFRLVGSGVATVVSVSGNITPFVLNGTDQAIERMTINGNGSTAHALTSAGATRMHVDWVRCTGFAGSPVVCTGTHTNSAIEHVQLDGNTGTATDVDLSAATGVTVERLVVNGDAANTYVDLGTSCKLRRSSLTSPTSGATARNAAHITGADCDVSDNTITWTNGNTAGSFLGFAIISHFTGPDRCTIVHNHIKSDGTMSGIGIGADGSTGTNTTVVDNVVSTNDIYNVTGDGIITCNPYSSEARHAITGNICNKMVYSANGFYGIGIESHGMDNAISGNTVSQCDDHGIYADGAGTVVGNNTVRVFGQGTGQDHSAGIVVGSASVIVAHNQCWDGGTATNTNCPGVMVRSDHAAAATTGCRIEGNILRDSRSGGSRTQWVGVYTYNSAATTEGNRYLYNDVGNNVGGGNLFGGLVEDIGGSGGTGQTTAFYKGNLPNQPTLHLVAQIALPSSGTVLTNTTCQDLLLTWAGGTVSNMKLDGVVTGLTTPGTVIWPAGSVFQPNYSVAPTTWQMYGL